MNEQELRELLKLIRGVEHFIERCLRTEEQKNLDRTQTHLEAQGVKITKVTKEHLGYYDVRMKYKPQAGTVAMTLKDVEDWNADHPDDPVEVVSEHLVEITEVEPTTEFPL